MVISRKKKNLRVHLEIIALVIICLICLLPMQAPQAANSLSESIQGEHQIRLSAINQKTVLLKQKNQALKSQYDKLKKEREIKRTELNPEQVTLSVKQKAMLDVALARANYDGSLITQAEIEQLVDATQVKINNLENELRNTTLAAGKTSTVKEQLKAIQVELNFQRDLLDAQRGQLEEARKVNDLSRQIFLLQKNFKSEIDAFYQLHQRQLRQKKLLEKETELEKKQQFWLEKLTDLNQDISVLDQGDQIDGVTREKIQLQIFEAQERSNLLNLELVIARIYNQLSSIMDTREDEMSVTALNGIISQLTMLANEVKNVEVLINRKVELIQLRKKINIKIKESSAITTEDLNSSKILLNELMQHYSKELAQIEKVQTQIKDAQAGFQKDLTHALSRRQGLPGFSLEAWTNLGEKLLWMPPLAAQAAKAFWVQMNRTFDNITLNEGLLILLAESFLFALWYFARKWLDKMQERFAQSKKRIAENFVFVLLQILHRNLAGLAFTTGVIALLWLGGIPLMGITPVFYLVLVWFVFKMAIQLAGLVLVENSTRVSGYDVKLYQNLRWALMGGGLLTLFTVFAHQLPVGYEVRDFFDRLFMVFMLVTSLVLLKGWRVIPELCEHFVDSMRPYLMRVVRLLSFLVPLTILSTALIGILGYVDFAWNLWKYEGIFLLIMTLYVLMRGFLNDFTEWLSELFIRRLRNGWLWTQAVLRPLDKIMHLALFLVAVWVLFISYGWDSESYVVKKLGEILDFHLIAYEGTVITPLILLALAAATAVILWVARWTREFSYRWLFSKTEDLGVRNSLAAFTQYMMVMLGAIIALKVIGVDFTGLSYILTALAFGIGFGLRDLAKNYVSGMLLLIERPVRAGDTITIGDYEGEVTHIGMRAMTVETWDHMEVLVPNSQIFESSFVNWTHQDSIVRTVIKIRINRQDDPVAIEALLMDLLRNMPEVVSDPEPQVLLIELQDSLVELEVRYFIDMTPSRSRAKVRSMVLFAIWECFKKHGITPPHPQQDIHVRTFPLAKEADAPLGIS